MNVAAYLMVMLAANAAFSHFVDVSES